MCCLVDVMLCYGKEMKRLEDWGDWKLVVCLFVCDL